MQVNQKAESVLEDFGRFDALVNNAGSIAERKLPAEISHDLRRRIIATNLDTVFLVIQALLFPQCFNRNAARSSMWHRLPAARRSCRRGIRAARTCQPAAAR